MNYKRRIVVDITLLMAAILPSALAYSFKNSVMFQNHHLFMRSGAIMVLFAAFLEFRTIEIRFWKDRDQMTALWKTLGLAIELIEKVDAWTKWCARSLTTVIESAGIEPTVGKTSEIKNIVLSETTKALRSLKVLPPIFYIYNSIISVVGKILVILGTLVWAFGDMVV
jgi:hypothetical protein